ncbi:MAG: fatty acid desaturase [Proteobacteria bacterium]|nr:fatty acid desaturase [Pseudomonadota bacterium]
MNSYWLLCGLVFLATYTINMVFISVFYHRGLTHGALNLSPFALKLVEHAGNWFTGLDPKGWICMHRLHHNHSDTTLDPHSPTHFGIFGVMRAQLKSYKKILYKLGKGDPATVAVVSDIKFGVSWLNRKNLWYLPYIVHGLIGFVLAVFGGWYLLGFCYFAGMMSHPIQGWMVNSLGHSKGYRNFSTKDDSTNNTLVAWTVMGEGFQNNHHEYPASPKFSCRWFEIDPGYGLCLVAERLSLLEIRRDLKIPVNSPVAKVAVG